jgi:hypothetical protein
MAWGVRHDTDTHARTLAFATLAFSLLVHSLADRAPGPFAGWRPLRRSTLPWFLAAALALLLGALYFPGLNQLLAMTSLYAEDWLTVLIVAGVATVAVELSKIALRADPGEGAG